MKDLPIYEMFLDDDDDVLGIYAVSLVDQPAMEAQWVAFSEDKQEMKCSIINKDEHKVLCVICRCDFPIYRRIPTTKEEFYAIYHRDTIEQMSQRMLKNGFQSEINIEHDDNAYVDGVELQEIFIKNVEKGINPAGFEDIEDYSLFGVYKIENEAVWEAIQNGLFHGVSLQGLFKYRRENECTDAIKNLEQLIDGLKNNK